MARFATFLTFYGTQHRSLGSLRTFFDQISRWNTMGAVHTSRMLFPAEEQNLKFTRHFFGTSHTLFANN